MNDGINYQPQLVQDSFHQQHEQLQWQVGHVGCTRVEREASQQGVEVELIASRVLAKEARGFCCSQWSQSNLFFSRIWLNAVSGKCQGAEMWECIGFLSDLPNFHLLVFFLERWRSERFVPWFRRWAVLQGPGTMAQWFSFKLYHASVLVLDWHCYVTSRMHTDTHTQCFREWCIKLCMYSVMCAGVGHGHLK